MVDEIASLVGQVAPPGAAVADLFAGSSVVSQRLAMTGHRVTSVDTQLYSASFATALLGVGRSAGEDVPVEDLLDEAAACGPSAWRSWRAREDDLLGARDVDGLRALGRSLPLAWREGRDRAEAGAPLTSFYSGSYFGVRQAMDLDALQRALRTRTTKMSPWVRAAAATALMHAASTVVHSAGKHFAQPLKEGGRNAAFLDGRLLSDRSLDVRAAFRSGCERIARAAPPADAGHFAVQAEAEDWVRGAPPQAVCYLDPPYTAQQYSRFYHVLETISTGALPSLPSGSAPSFGLYPHDRYKSAFSSRSRAPAAMEALLESVAAIGATAIISYSVSERGSDGNARMVTMEELLAACRGAFGRNHVDVIPLSHRYRQFNSALNANRQRDDREVLVLCRQV